MAQARRCSRSRATWKVIAADMPLGLVVYHDAAKQWGSEAVAQGDGPALGRELEIADLLRFIKHNDVRNVVWITADVHYCATHLYDPARAQFTDFNAVLRVRVGAAPRRRLRTQRARQHLRAPGALHAQSGRPRQHAADRGRSLLRPRAHRRPHSRDDRDPPRRHRRCARPAGAAARSAERGRVSQFSPRRHPVATKGRYRGDRDEIDRVTGHQPGPRDQELSGAARARRSVRDHPPRPVRGGHRPLRCRQDHAAAQPGARDDHRRRRHPLRRRRSRRRAGPARCAPTARGSA